MVTVKAPETYLNEYGIRKETGKYLSEFGPRVFIVAGKTAWEETGRDVTAGLAAWHCVPDVRIMTGYPTVETVRQYAWEAYGAKADAVLGIGGGRVIDAAKAAGNLCGLPVAALPTIAATCACWAARSILYDAEGSFDRIQWNRENTRLILADTEILTRAPRRTLASGILDSMAKWYEFEPLIAADPGDLVLRHDVATARLTLDLLREEGPEVYRGGGTPKQWQRVTDAIFYLTGATGSFAAGNAYRGFAHSWYFSTTRIPQSRHRMHGEKVAFGLLVQFLLAGKDEAWLRDFTDTLLMYDMTDVPGDWQVPDEETMIRELSERIIREWPVVLEKKQAESASQIAEAVREASGRLRKARKNALRES